MAPEENPEQEICRPSNESEGQLRLNPLWLFLSVFLLELFFLNLAAYLKFTFHCIFNQHFHRQVPICYIIKSCGSQFTYLTECLQVPSFTFPFRSFCFYLFSSVSCQSTYKQILFSLSCSLAMMIHFEVLSGLCSSLSSNALSQIEAGKPSPIHKLLDTMLC